MSAKITVNGVTYDSVEAMPPDVRRVYVHSLTQIPELADSDGDGIPDIVQREGLTLQRGTQIRQKFIVNGTTYESLESMPPESRRACEDAMRAARAKEPTVKNEIKLSFQLTGPKFSFRKTLGTSGASAPQAQSPRIDPASTPDSIAGMTPRSIEPPSTEGAIRVAIIIGGFAVVGLVVWFLTRLH